MKKYYVANEDRINGDSHLWYVINDEFLRLFKRVFYKKNPSKYRQIAMLDFGSPGERVDDFVMDLASKGLLMEFADVVGSLNEYGNLPFKIGIKKENDSLYVVISPPTIHNRLELERTKDVLKRLKQLLSKEASEKNIDVSYTISLKESKKEVFIRYILRNYTGKTIKLMEIKLGVPYFVRVTETSSGIFVNGEDVVFGDRPKLDNEGVINFYVRGIYSDDVDEYTVTPVLVYECDGKRVYVPLDELNIKPKNVGA